MNNGSGDSDCGLGIGEEGEACSQELLHRSTALFLLGLKEKHKLTQAAIQSVVDGVTSLLQQRLDICICKCVVSLLKLVYFQCQS